RPPGSPLFPYTTLFRSSAGDAGAHRAGVVLRAVLRDPARRAGQVPRRARHGRRHPGTVRPAVAGPPPREVDALPQLAVQAGADRVRRDLHRARLPRPEAADPVLLGTVAAPVRAVLPVLP